MDDMAAQRQASAHGAVNANLWQRIMSIEIGIMPLPIYCLLLGLIIAFYSIGKLPTEISFSIALLSVGGFSCSEIGKRLPFLRQIGAAAILATFLPSYLVYAKILPDPIIKNVTDFTKASNFLYLFIPCIIVGSILSMDRATLIAGFVKIFVPLVAGTVVAGCVGTLVGVAVGFEARHAFYFIVVPIMAGGVGEGAIPLSAAYDGVIPLQGGGSMLAKILPAVMFGSLTAIVFSGALNAVGKRYPHLTGNGLLQPQDPAHATRDTVPPPAARRGLPSVDVTAVAAAGVTAVAFYLIGLLGNKLFEAPAPVVMLLVAVVAKFFKLFPPVVEDGAYIVSRFFSTAVTYPLLFAIGVSLTPWKDLIGSLTPAFAVTVIATVASLMATGWFVGRFVGLYPIEAAIVNGCHSGQGGTGDVAILTAANRMSLMPFAQIATRIGGAGVITLALLTFRLFY